MLYTVCVIPLHQHVVNDDTITSVNIDQLEKAIRTLTHDWRNVLNGINLRITSAAYSEKPEELESDLKDAQNLIAAATKELTALSRKLTTPQIAMISYPATFFIEDLQAFLSQQLAENAMKLEWKKSELSHNVMVDFVAITQAVMELIGNAMRHLLPDGRIGISSEEKNGFLCVAFEEKKTAELEPTRWGMTPFSTNEKGRLGLGIFFVRRVLAAHGGGVDFSFSEAEKILKTILQIPLEVA